MGTIFPLALVVFQAFPTLHFTSKKHGDHVCRRWDSSGPVPLRAGFPPSSWLDMKHCKHTGGTTNLLSEVFGCFPPSWWVAKLLPPNPNARLAEKLLSGAVGTELPLLQSASLPVAVFAFSLISH